MSDRLKILVANDDRIEAQGLRALVDTLTERVGADVYVFAPNGQRSAASHAITLRNPVSVWPVAYSGACEAFALDGTPADCVAVGLKVLKRKGIEADMVFAGINHGSNVGTDTVYSGTVGAAMEAAAAMPEVGMLYTVNLRGKAGELRNHTPALVAEVRRLGIDLVVLDPRYKLVAEDEDENSAAGLRGVLDFRDALAEAAAVLMIGHDPKGDTAGKSMADRGAGSYTAGADYDFSFALSPHELDGYTVLSTSCRYRQSPPDLTIRFDTERQVFEAEADTPATMKQTRRGGGGTTADPKEKAERERLKLDALEKAVRDFAARNELMSMGTFRQNIRAMPEGAAFAQNPLRVAIDALIEKGVIAKTPEKMRTDGGEVRQTKARTVLVGTPEKVKVYDDSFTRLPL